MPEGTDIAPGAGPVPPAAGPAGEAAPIDVHLRDYLRVVRKHAGIALTFFLVVVAVVAVVTFRMRPVYRATSTLSIERQGPVAFALEGLVAPERPQDEYRKTQQELIRSRPIVGDTFQKLGLGEHEKFRGASDPVEKFRKCVLVAPREGTTLVDVSIETEDREKAADWVNALVAEYVDYMEIRYRSTSRAAEERIEKQIPELRRKLLESEEALARFLKDNNVLAFDKQLEILYRKLDAYEAKLASTETERIRLAAALEVLAANRNGGGAGARRPDAATSDVLKTLLNQEAALSQAFAEIQAKFKPGHPRHAYAAEQIRSVREKIEAEVSRIAGDLQAQRDAKEHEKTELVALVAAQSRVIGELESKSSLHQAIRQELDSNRRMYQEFAERRKEIESASKLGRTDVLVIEQARTPARPVRPKVWLNLTLAAVVGLLGGIALAFFLEYLDDSLKAPEEIEALGVSLLGVVPDLGRASDGTERDLVALKFPKSSAAEAFRSVRTALLFSKACGEDACTFLVTSSGPGEGKTLISVNLALTMARADKRVLLVDADMRKPSVHKVLGLPSEPGLSGYFAGESTFDEILRPGPIENLTVVSCGPIPPNPSELLGSPRVAEFLAEARRRFDRILFDTPPAVAVTDAVVLASQVHGVIFVVRAETTGKRTAGLSLSEIKRVGGKTAGVILNHFNARKAGYSRGAYSPYYYYYYRYYPYEKKDANPSP